MIHATTSASAKRLRRGQVGQAQAKPCAERRAPPAGADNSPTPGQAQDQEQGVEGLTPFQAAVFDQQRRAGDEQAGRKARAAIEERGGQQVGGRNQGHAGQEGDQAGAEDGITSERR
ncbi:hypothetical protein [Candidatus Amarolinea dominans]|uniref:hypothetical protein n=1 Tax=Candidatus Amarolinea dominans TaxID=3140696 RepID=UPI003136C64A|nr:hypothetical protein [Anaerolineae bacterium]